MKKYLLTIAILLSSLIVNSQTKKVLLEEYCGAHCGNCPLGSLYVDSMLALYPNLVAVSLHAYSPADAMHFPEIDTLYRTYSSGAPLGAIDRINHGSSSNHTARYLTFWNADIQSRLSVIPQLNVSAIPSWNSITRNLSAQVNVNILSNMSSGDYRINLFIIEDSVTGIGPGYNQVNFYNTVIGSPFYGLGNPIIGYVHRYVARALLPTSWGLSEVIPSTPTAGQNFTHIFNYTLPSTINENRVHLVAFVYKFTTNHLTDEVLNVNKVKLISSPTAINEGITNLNLSNIYPNPVYQSFTVEFPQDNFDLVIFDIAGRKIYQMKNASSQTNIDSKLFPNGIYFLQAIRGNTILTAKLIKQ